MNRVPESGFSDSLRPLMGSASDQNTLASSSTVPVRRSPSVDSIASSSASAKGQSRSPPRSSPPGLIHTLPSLPQLSTSSNASYPASSLSTGGTLVVAPPLSSKPLISVPPAPHSNKRTSPPPDVKSLTFIHSGPTSNPLSIRPSARPRVLQATMPSSNADKPVAQKKRLKVGAGWTPSRQNGHSDHANLSKVQTKGSSIRRSKSPESPMSISSTPPESSKPQKRPPELSKTVPHSSPHGSQEKRQPDARPDAPPINGKQSVARKMTIKIPPMPLKARVNPGRFPSLYVAFCSYSVKAVEWY
jgi:hypothetical protein